MHRTVAVVLALAIVSSRAAAQVPSTEIPVDEPGISQLVRPISRLEVDDPRLRSPRVALGLSLGITLASVAASIAMVAVGFDSREGGATIALGCTLGGLGLAFGPSAGHFYAGDSGHALSMGFARVGVVGGSFGLGLLALVAGFAGSEGAAYSFLAAGVAAGLTGIGLAIWDIATAPRAARRANERLRRRITGLALGPLVTPPVAGERGYGLSLSGRF